MVAHRRADRCRHWNSHGVYRQWIRDPKILVASSRDCDLRPDHCLRDHPGRAELDPSRDYVARDHQRFGLWWRVGLVFLFQTKRRRIFSRTEETCPTNYAHPTCLMSTSSTNRGNATAAGSRIRCVANRDKDVSSGFTSTSSPLLAMARNAQSMMYPNVAVVPMTNAKSQAPSSRKFSTR